jgi:HSP20 family protein
MDTTNNGDFTSRPSNALARRSEIPALPVMPIADIFETAEDFLIKLDMPGAAKESIHVTVENDQLKIWSSVVVHRGEEGALLLSEIGRKRYRRAFNLGRGVDQQHIHAQCEDGVLTVIVPKTEAGKVHEIQIR